MTKILIISANYYKEITNLLEKKTITILKKNKINLSTIKVTGVYEIPVVIKRNIKNFDAFIALGCVLKGNTPHFDFICRSTFDEIIRLSSTFGKPIGNGIITALNKKQAYERAGKLKLKKNDKGTEAANAVLSVLNNVPQKI